MLKADLTNGGIKVKDKGQCSLDFFSFFFFFSGKVSLKVRRGEGNN